MQQNQNNGNMTTTTTNATNNVKNDILLSFYLQFQKDVGIAKTVLEHYPSLKYDFQIMVDGMTGKIFHLDFDRVYQQPNNSTDKAQRIGGRVHKHLDILRTHVEQIFFGGDVKVSSASS